MVRRIRYRPVERVQWRDAAVRGFVLTAAGNMRVSEQLELLDAHWIEMEQTARDLPDGPWMFAVTRRRITRIALDR